MTSQLRRTGAAGLAIALLTMTGLATNGTSALAVGGQPLATGLNADGQLGNGTTQSSSSPVSVSVPPNMIAVASGREHAYGLSDSNRVWAWGDNSRGAVGDGSTSDRPTPVQLALTNVIQVEAGHYHGVALRSDGTVWTWGYGGLGQLGLGTTNNRTSPVQVPGLSGIVAVAAGRDMSYALRTDGTMLGWGGNSFGEVGDGTTTRRLSPVDINGVTNVVEMAGGRNHVLVVRTDGSLWAWGANESGQLGIGSTVNRLTPVQVLAGPLAHVDAGAEHSIAVMADGTVRTWGRGQRGQLGLGTTTTRTTPQVVPGVSGIVDVGDGRDTSFAINAAGQVWAWGHNDSGQLGDGTISDRRSPVLLGLEGIVAAQGGRGMTIFLPGAPDDPDIVPPSEPGVPSASSTLAGRADVAWTASTDDQAATLTYRVFRDDGAAPVASFSGPTTGTVTFADVGLVSGSIHTYRVQAFDGANLSALSQPSNAVEIVGTIGAPVLLQSNFDGGLTGWTVAGGFTIDSASGSPAAPSARVAVTNAAAEGRSSLSVTAAEACVSFDVNPAAVVGTARYSLVKVRNTAAASIGRIELTSAGALSVRADVTGTRFSVTGALPFNSWHRLTLCVGVGSAGSLRLDVDGVARGSWTTNTGLLPISVVQLGDNELRSATVNWDSVVVTQGLL